MLSKETSAYDLALHDFDKIKQLAKKRTYEKDSQIFAEGDIADCIYFIESGSVSIVIQKFTSQEEVSRLGAGEYFGEMAFFCGDQRSAAAVTLSETTLLVVDKDSFLKLLDDDKSISDKINYIVARRNDELTLKENLLESMCVKSKNLHIGIKGDPSLRESAFTRARYESVVDKILPALQPCLYELLMNRCVCELTIHFNSGEVHLRSIFNPLVDEIHPAGKLLNKAYIDRHFPHIDYQQKIDLARRLYDFISNDFESDNLGQIHNEALHVRRTSWEPMAPAGIPDIVSRLIMLRKMEDFYLRNITISVIEDAVRMQFNCDGAHILSTDRYQEFLHKNVPQNEKRAEKFVERRQSGRRGMASGSKNSLIDRRSPPGRRQEDWDEFTLALREHCQVT